MRHTPQLGQSRDARWSCCGAKTGFGLGLLPVPLLNRDRPWARVAEQDAAFAFLEDPASSLPIDHAQECLPGPLEGALIGVKSNIAVAGQAWTAGIKARSSKIASGDARAVSVLRDAGARLISRLTMDEAALGAATEQSGFRATENPAARGYSVGGSSGGSAAAVACGAVQVALGSDTLGSVRIPAAYCGVFGLKPGRDVLPLEGVFPLAPGFDTLGLLARDPAEIGRVFAVFEGLTGCPSAGVYLVEPGEDVPCAPEVMAALARAERAFRDAGRWRSRMRLANWTAEPLRRSAFGLVCAQAAETLAGQVLEGAAVRKAVAYGARLSAGDIDAAQAQCQSAARLFQAAVADGTILLLATTPQPPKRRDQAPPTDQAIFTVPANLSGLPALAVPIAGPGSPCSVQLMGPSGSEGTLLELAALLRDAGVTHRTPE